LNELITGIYLGKYAYNKIVEQGLRQLSIFPDSSKYDFAYDVIEYVEKSKSVSKRLSSSK